MKSKRQESSTTIFVIVLLLLLLGIFWPIIGIVGLVIMWIKTSWSLWIKWIITLPFVALFITMIALPVFMLIYLFVARPVQVTGDAMSPSYTNGMYLITKPLNRSGDVIRGDVVVFARPDDQSQLIIKRIVGMPGETVRIFGGAVYINGNRFDERSYLPEGRETSVQSFMKEGEVKTIPVGQYFVLGDNRSHSADSRQFGFIAREQLLQIVQSCFWNCH